MSRKNRNALADRVVKAAEAALAAQGYVSPIDVLAVWLAHADHAAHDLPHHD